MIFNTRTGRRSTAAAIAGTLGLLAFGLTPSVADGDTRAAFDALDLDRDGRVTLDEFANPAGRTLAFIGSPQNEEGGESGQMTTVDVIVNDDGEVSWTSENEDGPVELDLTPLNSEAMNRIAQREFAVYDTDDSGDIAFEEYENRHRRLMRQAFASMDTDGDGRVNADELSDRLYVFAESAGDEIISMSLEFTQEHFEGLDTNNDGVVTIEEFEANLGENR